jgi:hypothetical protein
MSNPSTESFQKQIQAAETEIDAIETKIASADDCDTTQAD